MSPAQPALPDYAKTTRLVARALKCQPAQLEAALRPATLADLDAVVALRRRVCGTQIQWDDALILHTHMRMTGSWHLYRSGERWRKPPRQARVVIEVPEWVAVCFNAPVVETYRSMDRRRHPGFGGLGPDLCDPAADLRECVRALLRYPDPDRPIAEVLLDLDYWVLIPL